MSGLTVDLQEGFFREEVVIAVNGREAVRRSGLTTRMQTGLAASIELADPGGTARLEVTLPAKGVQGGVDLPPARPVWVGVSLDPSGRLSIRLQHEPFGYL